MQMPHGAQVASRKIILEIVVNPQAVSSDQFISTIQAWHLPLSKYFQVKWSSNVEHPKFEHISYVGGDMW